MGERNFAIYNKAACYGVGAFGILMCAMFHWLGSNSAFPWGVFLALVTVAASELLIVIPDKETD